MYGRDGHDGVESDPSEERFLRSSSGRALGRRSFLGAALAAAAGATLGRWRRSRGMSTSSPVVRSNAAVTSSGPGPPAERELVAVFVGSPTCRFSRPELLAPNWERASETLKGISTNLHYGFRATGVALSTDVSLGVEYLGRISHSWDEIAVGRRWRNLALWRWVWEERVLHPATPQLLLAKQELREISGFQRRWFRAPAVQTITVLSGLQRVRRVEDEAFLRWLSTRLGASAPLED